jgi:hypothetical protein
MLKQAIRLGLNPEQADRALVARIRAAWHAETAERDGSEPLPTWAEDEGQA